MHKTTTEHSQNLYEKTRKSMKYSKNKLDEHQGEKHMGNMGTSLELMYKQTYKVTLPLLELLVAAKNTSIKINIFFSLILSEKSLCSVYLFLSAPNTDLILFMGSFLLPASEGYR